MAPFSTRKPAPAWPPLRDAYKRISSGDDIQLTSKSDLDTSTSFGTSFGITPTPRTATFKRPSTKWSSGWRGGAKIAFSGALTVFIINSVLLVAMVSAFPRMDGMSMIYIGSCTTSERINTGIHFIVNVLSTCLLAASNYCMQILSAPTREDVDKAHAKCVWLDIGIASLRNLKMLRKKKVVLWWLLAISSIPLHLFYNSVFFTAIATNNYNILYATEDFVQGAAYNTQEFPDTRYTNVSSLQTQAKSFERLDNKACINAYGLDFVTDRKDVIAVIRSNASTESSSLQKVATNVIPPGGFNSKIDSFAWICDDASLETQTNSQHGMPCSRLVGTFEQTANQHWSSGGFEIEYCLSEPIVANCHVHFAPQIMAPVLFFNIMKAIIIAYVAFFYSDQPIVTIGDAIESFSLQPDPTTRGMCLATHDMIESHWVKGYTPQPIRYNGQRRRWVQSASRRQWIVFGSVFIVAIVAVCISIGLGIDNSDPKTVAGAWAWGIGKVRTQNLITGVQATQLGANAVFVSAIIANLPQAVFSFIYLIYNNVFTTMVLSNEWDRFSIKSGTGRVLRVSQPKGDQKSTYFLQIQYRYAIVMLSTSGILHWLVSQSVFLANISVIGLDGVKPKQDEITTCAYSVKAMFFIVAVEIFMLVWIFSNGLRKFSGGMPFVGSNSAAISAACHPEYGLYHEREMMVVKPLRWGVTDYGTKKSPNRFSTLLDSTPPLGEEEVTKISVYDKGHSSDEEEGMSGDRISQGPIGHCNFTDGRVGKPVSGRFYA